MKVALALCGGGSLGAYELGVWQYLREHDFEFDIVTGTSIGAINGAMIVTGQYEVAKEMWEKISVSDVMRHGIDFDRNFLSKIELKSDSQWSRFVKSYFKNKGADTTPLLEMLNEKIAPLQVNKADKKFGIVICRYPSFKEEDILVNSLKDEEVVDYIMASASCWPVFPVYHMKGEDYVDGGWKNNLPIDFALRLGADKVIAVLLNSLPKAQRRYLFNLPNVTLIQPSLPQGSFLAFTHNAIESNIKMGYLDAAKTFGTMKGNRSTIEATPKFTSFVERYYKGYVKNDPADFLKVEKDQKKNILLTIEDRKERSFILELEEVMDIYGVSFREPYEIGQLMNILSDKIEKESESKKQKTFKALIEEVDAPKTSYYKGLWYFAKLFKKQ